MKHLRNILELIGDCMIIAWGILSTYTFLMVKFRGVSYIYEGNDLILNIELCLSPIVLLLGIYLLYRDGRRIKSGKDN